MLSRTVLSTVLAICLAAWHANPASAENGFGLGNWGGSSVAVGRKTFYANGLVSNRVGRTEYFNNGLVGMRYGNVTLYNNGLAAAHGRHGTVFSNVAVGVPVRPAEPVEQTGLGRPGITVYGGGYPYPLGPGPYPFGPPSAARPPAASAPRATTPWSRPPRPH
ncbi:MAG: hypothetical protein FJ284_14445 [Planctomycetes bacterium]|nr:hypothetical protein [Planctomycetota bacterium]